MNSARSGKKLTGKSGRRGRKVVNVSVCSSGTTSAQCNAQCKGAVFESTSRSGTIGNCGGGERAGANCFFWRWSRGSRTATQSRGLQPIVERSLAAAHEQPVSIIVTGMEAFGYLFDRCPRSFYIPYIGRDAIMSWKCREICTSCVARW